MRGKVVSVLQMGHVPSLAWPAGTGDERVTPHSGFSHSDTKDRVHLASPARLANRHSSILVGSLETANTEPASNHTTIHLKRNIIATEGIWSMESLAF